VDRARRAVRKALLLWLKTHLMGAGCADGVILLSVGLSLPSGASLVAQTVLGLTLRFASQCLDASCGCALSGRTVCGAVLGAFDRAACAVARCASPHHRHSARSAAWVAVWAAALVVPATVWV
jgi:hypothetical protein